MNAPSAAKKLNHLIGALVDAANPIPVQLSGMFLGGPIQTHPFFTVRFPGTRVPIGRRGQVQASLFPFLALALALASASASASAFAYLRLGRIFFQRFLLAELWVLS
jgi:hypothetical protein